MPPLRSDVLPDAPVSDPVFEVSVGEPAPPALVPSTYARFAATMVPAASLPEGVS
jgi:hypothetical protein